MIEGCAVEADTKYRLLLSNAELGVPLMAQEVQAGLDFHQRPRELFDGREMGDDALRLLREYRLLLQEVRDVLGREVKVLKESIKWLKTI